MNWANDWYLILYFLIVRIVIALIPTVVLAFSLNMLFRSRPTSHVLSSSVICVAGFTTSFLVGLLWPGPFDAMNGEPMNFKTWLLYNGIWVDVVVGLLFVVVWQGFVRHRTRR